MASDDRVEFDPKEIARVAFPTAFRGYDTEAVRRYLTRLAAAVGRAQQLGLLGSVDVDDNEAHIRAAEAEHEVAELRNRVAELEELLQADDGYGSPDQDAAPDGRSDHDGAETAASFGGRSLDESELISQLGQQTVRIVEAARSAASDIVARAEEEAAAVRNDASLDVRAARDQADQLLVSARAEAEEILANATVEVGKGEARLKAEIKRSRDNAKADADAVLADASNKAESDLAAARQRANQVVVDAEQLREDILGDLVRRRRVTGEQLEVMTDARDRLALSLASARTELDHVASEIHSVIGDGVDLDLTDEPIRTPTDGNEVAELVSQLQGSAAEIVVPVTGNGNGDHRSLDNPDDDHRDGTASYGNSDQGHGEFANGSIATAEQVDVDEDTLRLTAMDANERTDGSHESYVATTEHNPDPVLDHHFDTDDRQGEADDGYDEAGYGAAHSAAQNGISTEVYSESGSDADFDYQPAVPFHGEVPFHGDAPIDGDRLLDQLGFGSDPVLGTGTGSMQRSATRGDLVRNTPYGGNLPPPFEARDIALTRSTAGFRRRLKRAVNDDQSDVLDRLRAGKGRIEPRELPDLDDQLDVYVSALRPSLTDVVVSGGELLGSDDLPEAALENLCVQLAKHIVDNLRLPTIDAIDDAASDDREAILDPVRAIYRDFRNTLLPDLIEDALHEAFALGLFYAVPSDGFVVWSTDPRLDSDPICEENSASPALFKGADFPSGHARPLSMPGCRCLAVPVG